MAELTSVTVCHQDDLIDNDISKCEEDVEVNANDDFHPCVGMEFESEEDAYNFYNQYARGIGFSAWRSSTQKSKCTGDLIARSFCCSLQGYREIKSDRNEQKKRVPVESRTGCMALMNIRKTGTRWIITRLVEEHNHILSTPRKCKQNNYILKWQTENARSGLVVGDRHKDIQANCEEPVTVRYSNLYREATKIAEKACTNNEVYSVEMNSLCTTLNDVEDTLKRTSVAVPSHDSIAYTDLDSQHHGASFVDLGQKNFGQGTTPAWVLNQQFTSFDLNDPSQGAFSAIYSYTGFSLDDNLQSCKCLKYGIICFTYAMKNCLQPGTMSSQERYINGFNRVSSPCRDMLI
uniref:FAR1 domain-containing protein n=1 Tax=Nelumbo nucifera TaxID=4432 RepID=A0A822XEW9_NELNU|nr:TPA_asm: hypothetical protein HUJ06_019905 [Nelumbo nucifera]